MPRFITLRGQLMKNKQKSMSMLNLKERQDNNYNYGRMHCACTKLPYFHFRSTIWRHHRVPQFRFSARRGNFGDSRIYFKQI